MMDIFLALLSISGSFFTVIGLITFILTIVRPMRSPADASNRIAHLILVWEALKSPHRFVELKDRAGGYPFAYLKQDLRDFIDGER